MFSITASSLGSVEECTVSVDARSGTEELSCERDGTKLLGEGVRANAAAVG